MSDQRLEHEYVSTACQHRLHQHCRTTCKFCHAECICVCHRWRIELDERL